MTLIIEAHKQCKKCSHFQVCSSVLKNDLFIREAMLGEKEPKCKMFVEVVRCKDCKRWQKDTFSCDFMKYGTHVYQPNWYEEDFCSYGERKDNG